MGDLLGFPGIEVLAWNPWPRETEDDCHAPQQPRVTKGGHLSAGEQPLLAGGNLLWARRGRPEDDQISGRDEAAVSSQLSSDPVTSGQTREDRVPEASSDLEADCADFQTSSQLEVHF